MRVRWTITCLVLSASIARAQPMAIPIDVSTVTMGAPATIAALDLGKLQGELRQVGWSVDGTRLYVQTVDGVPPNEKLHHYTVPLTGGGVQAIEAQPAWASAYWAAKSDRVAPGVPSVDIEVKQESTHQKVGTGSARPGSFDGATGGFENAAMGGEGQKLPVVRFLLLGETVSEFVNERPIPGLMFGWGPRGTGAIAFTDRGGRLFLLDQEAHKRGVAGAKDALLPAWSTDGTQLAWVQKRGRRKYVLVVASVTRG